MNQTTLTGSTTVLQTLILLCCLLFTSGVLFAEDEDEDDKGVAKAPAGTDVLESSFEGTWFVDSKLKKRYDELLTQVRTLEQRILKGDISTTEARDSIEELRGSLAEVRAEIDKQKTLVSPFEIVTQKTEGTIELGKEQLLVVTADRIKVVGWDKPHVKYVLMKKVLSTGKPVDDHLARIKIVHEHKVAPELVGKTDAAMKAWRDEFLKAPEGEKQTADQLEQKKETWERHFAHELRFVPFVGKEVDALHLEGLNGGEGNQQVRYEVLSPEGNGRVGSRWRRSADLTLYVPKCTALLLRGCQRGMDISGVNTDLTMTELGSQHRDYSGKFLIRDHVGQLTLGNVPVDVIEHVEGDVKIASTTEMGNTGSHHSGDDWVLSTPLPRELKISGVTGNLTARFRRSNLHIDKVGGVLNVHNEYGDTHCSISDTLVAGNHRIVSQSGLVSVEVASETIGDLTVFAATSCGTAATNLGRDELDDLNVTYTSFIDGLRCEWRSLFSKVARDDFQARFALQQRPDDILSDLKRSHGLDLVSVAGRVEYRKK
jgi:uncharacterized coiled-coil protein SlyX